MSVITPDELLRAIEFAEGLSGSLRGVSRSSRKTDGAPPFYRHLIGRLGEIAFRNEAIKALPNSVCVGELNWTIKDRLPNRPRVGDGGVDLHIGNWGIDVKAGYWQCLTWPECRAHLFPFVRFDRDYRILFGDARTARGVAIGKDISVVGELDGWIPIDPAMSLVEWLDDDRDCGFSPCDEALANSGSLWALLSSSTPADGKRATAAWKSARARGILGSAMRAANSLGSRITTFSDSTPERA